ncbi:MAG: hypothetical protein AAF065_03300 [Verrucomicrobiota bacterium]
MQLVTESLPQVSDDLERVLLIVDRHKLARKRWRGVAEDGTDFGFDVIEALSHGDCIHISDTKAYFLEQSPEACFLIGLTEAKHAAWLGWMIGNLHFKAAFSDEGVLVQDDLAVEQMLEREHIHYHRVERIFRPSKQGGHSHNHHHDHSH